VTELQPSSPVPGDGPASGAARFARPTGAVAIRLTIVSPVRLFGEALAQALRCEPGIEVTAVLQHPDQLLDRVRAGRTNIVLIDVTGTFDPDEVRAVAVERPEVKLVALGLDEHAAEVVRCARAGFSGYVPRDIPLDELVARMGEVLRGAARCSAEIAAGLLQALFRPDLAIQADGPLPSLTRRESEILRLLGRSFSNKEIARDLGLSVATVKNHVHNLLAKLKLSRRSDAARCVRDRPWIIGPGLG